MPAPATPAGAPNKPQTRPPAYDPVANARERISKKRYDDRHQQVTGMIDRMRDKRRKLFGRLWIASVVLTALSIVALAVEVIQGLSFTAATAETVPAAESTESGHKVVRKAPAQSSQAVVHAEAQSAAYDQTDAAKGENQVKSALYTTDGQGKPKGVWLDGTINDTDSETANR
jgi:hypothetical protein